MRLILLDLPFLMIKGLLTVLVFLTPVLGVWLASSLVAYTNGPIELAVLSGILLFPLLPIAWDLWGRKRRQRRPQIITCGDRIILRTLLLNLVFLGCLLALRPQTAFLALSTRGDWMLDGKQGTQVEWVRRSLFQAANRLEWLYLAVHQNPYQQYADSREVRPASDPQISPQPSPLPTAPSQLEQPSSSPWPWANTQIHPAIATLPASVETSIASVAQYIAQQERDPFLRVKALHDYVADRIAYDAPSYFAGRYPPQDAETVFTRRTAVCAGYAKLLEALGNAIGEEIVYVVGDARTETSDLNGQSHAWNAAKVKGTWYLIDATWDSGSVDASGFKKGYRADFLFPPPTVMSISHFPQEVAWQLLAKPLSRGEFLRQPMLQPQFFAQGLKLISPTRSQTDVSGDPAIELENPQRRWLMATYSAKGSNQSQRCVEQTSQGLQLSCPLPSAGAYEVALFSGKHQYGQYEYVGQIEFNKG
ncbi:transglutaminase domain-containing protein [Phormidesmis sp. 146-12]